ncbi:reverse transcriptase domain-containing protein [Wenzhouxiangella sp. AB-CW3]|uniref:reverse transcriptase domain-containing protein n=1 Tax=Wenzhouxiangella sp. AB-CW3 TaxID=2771012 RepID=UPI0021E05719|nr:reverse transcriptase domain-containing protein [Wenzhouxiangella sp. AB-CW3]
MTGERTDPASTSTVLLWEKVLERSNLQRAVKQVRQNKGAPGIDGMSVDALPDFLRQNWPAIRDQLEAGQYRPQPVRRVRIPKADGRERLLGIPTVLDRFIQQAVAQVVSAQWDPHFHPRSYGFRPGKSAHQALKRLQADIRAGGQWTVDLDLAAFFDRVNHDRLMRRLKDHVPDRRLLRLINRFLTAGVMDGDHWSPTNAGVPQRRPAVTGPGQRGAG